MSHRLFRRRFIQRGLASIASLFVLGKGSKKSLAAEKVCQEGCSCCSGGNETLKTIGKLRTTHGNFTAQAVEQDKLDMILDATVRAANSSNMQTYSIVVVKDRAKMKKLSGYQAGAMLVYCVDYNRIKASAKSLGHSYQISNTVPFVTGCVNTGLAVQTAAIAARSLGLDYLITNGIHRGDMSRIWDVLNLPKKHCFPLIALYLGYPSEEPDVHKGRLEQTGIIYDETHHTLSRDELDDITRQYDDKDRHIGLVNDWDQQGHKHYLDWLYTKWLGNRPSHKGEPQMLTMLKRSGFIS